MARRLPDQLVEVVHAADSITQLASEHGEVPAKLRPRLAHLYIGAQSILGACHLFGYQPPIDRHRFQALREVAGRSLTPYSPFSQTVEDYNERLAAYETSKKRFFSVGPSTYFDMACANVAENPNVSIADLGLVVENSSFGQPDAGFVNDRLRFPRKTGPLKELLGNEVGPLIKKSYARRLGYAVSLAAYERQANFTPEVASSRLQRIAIGSLALEFSLKTVGHAKYLAEQAGEVFIPSPAEAYHINRITNLISNDGPIGPRRNEIRRDHLIAATNVAHLYGEYGDPLRAYEHGETTPFSTDLVRTPHWTQLDKQ